jgi:DNA repair protein RecN (Recombination protein N)
MLLKLYIENYALIQKLGIDLDNGFTVITGETGAGKSILVGALSLILGQRADTSVLLEKTSKCIVEGTFVIRDYGLEDFFMESELDYDAVAILRREINQNGKSRAFINDTPVNLSVLKELGDRLVNIHSQHSVVTLSKADFQLELLDDYAGHQARLTAYRTAFLRLRELLKKLRELEEKEKRLRSESDYHQFLFDELEKAALKEQELEDLENHFSVLSHAEEIKSSLTYSVHQLTASEQNEITQLAGIIHSLKSIVRYHPPIEDLLKRLESILIDFKDIAGELQKMDEQIYVSSGEMEGVRLRLDLIYRLLKKHNVQSVQELIHIQGELGSLLSETESLDDLLRELQHQVRISEDEVLNLAKEISAARSKVIPGFEKEIQILLKDLGMPSARFKINLEQVESYSMDGLDRVTFLFSANKGVPLGEVSRIASGGELSRLMLSIKSRISRKNLLPTIIFDEIDSGVSGDVAGKVGTILKEMAGHMQVIVITHLPQIAGKGTSHFWVYKEDIQDSTRSMIRKLTTDERIEEIARMVSNERVTEAAYLTARELLAN